MIDLFYDEYAIEEFKKQYDSILHQVEEYYCICNKYKILNVMVVLKLKNIIQHLKKTREKGFKGN